MISADEMKLRVAQILKEFKYSEEEIKELDSMMFGISLLLHQFDAPLHKPLFPVALEIVASIIRQFQSEGNYDSQNSDKNLH